MARIHIRGPDDDHSGHKHRPFEELLKELGLDLKTATLTDLVRVVGAREADVALCITRKGAGP